MVDSDIDGSNEFNEKIIAEFGDDGFVILASNGGSPTHPSWYYNLKTNPQDQSRGRYQKAHGTGERAGQHGPRRLVAELVASAPSVGEFQAKTTRQIPLFVLTRED
jgi:deazaflavin-dependent oxidoreductase (nitroreductase family)